MNGGGGGGGGAKWHRKCYDINLNITNASQSSTYPKPEQWTLTFSESIHTDNIGSRIRQDQGSLR